MMGLLNCYNNVALFPRLPNVQFFLVLSACVKKLNGEHVGGRNLHGSGLGTYQLAIRGGGLPLSPPTNTQRNHKP